MYKVTQGQLVLFVFLFFINACNGTAIDSSNDIATARLDSLSEAIIDSAYIATNRDCDSLLLHQVPVWTKEVQQKDSSHLLAFTDSMQLYNNTVPKVEKVIRQLKADCATNLRTETYKRVYQLQKLKSPIKGRSKF
jgi:hypothetical protein